jgi:hypothetical protein
VLPLFLTRVVQSLGNGGDSDNFRTMQRALQIFKNKKILNLIKICSTENDTNDNNNNNDNDNDNDNDNIKISQNTDDCYNANEQEPSSLDTVLTALIPALFRGGNLSWNPTVNKMTGIYMYVCMYSYTYI